MAKVIIGIHGLANKPSPEKQREGWFKAINEGLRANEPQIELQLHQNEFVDVYWADHLYKYPLHGDVNFNFDPLYDDEPYAPQAGALREYKEGWLDALRGRGQDAVDILFDKLPERFASAGPLGYVMEKVVRDLAFYYDPKRQLVENPGQQNPAHKPAKTVLQQKLRKPLLEHLEKGDQIMLIAHSMGSIIAYDVLRDLGKEKPNLKLHSFVTVGSPLGLPLVKKNVRMERDVARTPSIVERAWINFADPRDPVAADTRLRGDYEANARGVRVYDDLVWNDYEHKGQKNHHKIFGYLRTPEMSRLLKDFLKA